ncbi:MAG: tetratricopeptide repeat protein [Deltaproteobacteria bacterium]|nr:tetratricopeptide repeat protein [Sandaracinaceae bacterium]MCX7808646.1 tetratricopeptide repeat protein [Deltaproteobacteria bacterium]MDW8244945.1 tetratricopeptide repeat protein [Sandaracinaceae bacterium]
MSFLRRLFGLPSTQELRDRADHCFAAKDFVEARVLYEKLLDRKDLSPSDREYVARQIRACSNALAEARIAQAEALIGNGDFELARAELVAAAEIARDEAIRKRAARMLDSIERLQVQRHTIRPKVEPSDEERWLMISSRWSEAQYAEYKNYGPEFREAILAMEAGKPEEALPILESLVKEEGATFVWAELARARSRVGDESGSIQAIAHFLERVPDPDRSETRIEAHLYLAHLAERDGDDERAIAEYERAIDAMPDDPRPLIHFGHFLRRRGEAGAAISVFESALGLLAEDQLNWPILTEIALAKRDLGRIDEAIDTLERIVRYFLSRSQIDLLPPSAVVPLAELYERQGELAKAADLYALLSRGQDTEHAHIYYKEAGRLLAKLGLRSEARKMLMRASALVDRSSEFALEVESLLNQIENDEG